MNPMYCRGVGIVRKDQKVVGFITAQPMTKEQAGYDLLRILPEEPEELADYLLANLFIVYEKMGYLEANLGLAPLANVGETDFSFFQEKSCISYIIMVIFLFLPVCL